MNYQAVIFDLNGTILTDEDEYGQAFINVLKTVGVDVNKDPHTPGIGVKENWLNFKTNYKLNISKTMDELVNDTQREYIKLIKKVTLRDGFIEYADRLRGEKIPMALATSNNYSIVQKVFEVFDIEKYFDVVTTAEEVFHNKPNPEIYEITADKLGVSYGECLVFEDSQAGIDAANAIGMQVVAVLREEEGKEELKGAETIISDFNNLDI